MAKPWPSKESDLAPGVIAYLQNMRWEVYQEVQIGAGGDIADIVARQGRLVWVIELKKSLSLEVIAQASLWTRRAHFASVAIPQRQTSRRTKGQWLADEVLEWKGLGCFVVNAPTSYSETGANVRVMPRLHRKAEVARLREVLCEEHKTFAEAGNAEGRRWTPFQRTCRAVLDAASRKPGMSMKELVDCIDHHYASDKGARAHLASWIKAGTVEGVRVEQEGRALRVYPVAPA